MFRSAKGQVPVAPSLLLAAMLALAACGAEVEISNESSAAAADSEDNAEIATSVVEENDSEPEVEDEPEPEVEEESVPEEEEASEPEELFPDVLEAVAVLDGSGTWTFDATLSSPYDTPQRYADAWRVVGPDGTVFGIRELTHDHASEQPFTRSQTGIEIPEDVQTVTVEGRDQISGWGGATVEVNLSR